MSSVMIEMSESIKGVSDHVFIFSLQLLLAKFFLDIFRKEIKTLERKRRKMKRVVKSDSQSDIQKITKADFCGEHQKHNHSFTSIL